MPLSSDLDPQRASLCRFLRFATGLRRLPAVQGPTRRCSATAVWHSLLFVSARSGVLQSSPCVSIPSVRHIDPEPVLRSNPEPGKFRSPPLWSLIIGGAAPRRGRLARGGESSRPLKVRRNLVAVGFKRLTETSDAEADRGRFAEESDPGNRLPIERTNAKRVLNGTAGVVAHNCKSGGLVAPGDIKPPKFPGHKAGDGHTWSS